jgi:hypothetical protein
VGRWSEGLREPRRKLFRHPFNPHESAVRSVDGLREDNRDIPSTESRFFKRTKHVISSVFVAQNDGGGEHFAFSRIGSAAGASFISRA